MSTTYYQSQNARFYFLIKENEIMLDFYHVEHGRICAIQCNLFQDDTTSPNRDIAMY